MERVFFVLGALSAFIKKDWLVEVEADRVIDDEATAIGKREICNDQEKT